MKNNAKRLLAAILAMVMILACMSGCGSTADDTPATNAPEADNTVEVAPGKGGTIMWMSHLTNGHQYDRTVTYLEAICEALGYELTVVYGDMANDAAGNLQAVKNGMTNDVVGLIASMDGGLLNIMEEYPELYVVGFATDMSSVYTEGGANAACLENDHYLGTICDGFADGADLAQLYYEVILEKGYKKIAIVDFPAFAYPNLAIAADTLIALIGEYNNSVAEEDKITIVGEKTTLMFSPLEDSWFLEEGHSDLDCIVGMCAGTTFIYPVMVTAIGNGICSAETQLITGGFDIDDDLISNIGDEGIISMVQFSPNENPAFAMALLDNAINGVQYADWNNGRVDSLKYVIDSTEDINNVMTKSFCGTGDLAQAQLSVADVLNLCVRNNPDATYADLIAALHDEATMSVDALKNR